MPHAPRPGACSGQCLKAMGIPQAMACFGKTEEPTYTLPQRWQLRQAMVETHNLAKETACPWGPITSHVLPRIHLDAQVPALVRIMRPVVQGEFFVHEFELGVLRRRLCTTCGRCRRRIKSNRVARQRLAKRDMARAGLCLGSRRRATLQHATCRRCGEWKFQHQVARQRPPAAACSGV